MDLESKGRADLAAYFINRYFEKTDDYDSMQLFNVYFVYRCLVRAKVAALRAAGRKSDDNRQADIAEAKRYCEMAVQQAKVKCPRLVVMHGLSGSGKTWLSERLMAALPAVRIRSDLLRRRLFGLSETAQSGSAVAAGIYATDADADVYTAMRNRAAIILRAEHDVILDATFLHHDDRDRARCLAADCDATFLIVRATANAAELRRRITTRARNRSDPSEANLAVLEYQEKNVEALTDAELACSISVDSSDADASDSLLVSIRRLSERS
jgi:predicted kinase